MPGILWMRNRKNITVNQAVTSYAFLGGLKGVFMGKDCFIFKQIPFFKVEHGVQFLYKNDHAELR